MKFTKSTMAAAALAGALTTMTFPVAAQDAADDASSETTLEERRAEFEERKADKAAEFAQALANELGLDVDTVTTALESVHSQMQADRQANGLAMAEARLADKVASGDLTQAEADEKLAEITEQIESGEFRPGRRGHRAGGPGERDGHGPRGGGAPAGAPAAEGASLA